MSSIISGHMEGPHMRNDWTDWIFPILVCIVFPATLPMMLLAVLVLSVANAMKKTLGDEYEDQTCSPESFHMPR